MTYFFVNSNVRVISDYYIGVDTCETWTTSVYRYADGALVDSDGPTLLPQTITLEYWDAAWYITQVVFYQDWAFCR